MATDNRTLLNACDADTDAWAGDGGATDNSEAGNFYEGGISQGVTLSNSLEREVCRTIGGTRDLSDSQVWVVVKDGLASSRAAGGFQVVIEDAADEIGFFVGGFDFLPMGLPSFFWSLRLDVSESGVFDTASETTAYGGSFAGLDETSIIGVGYGTIHAAKAKSENAYIDGLYFIANGSYATTIDAGTVGTPDTFALVVADDVTNGTGTWSNLQGDKFDTNASWEWGVSANQDSYFTDAGFQVFIDANDVGVGNFIVGLTAGSGTNSLVLDGGLFQNLGTPSVWDMSSANFNTVELDLIIWNDIGTFSAPSSGGTSRFTTNCTWARCDVITNNGADMDGSSILDSLVAADIGALLYNEASDPDGTLDNMEFLSGAAAHHAIDFGTAVDSSLVSITLRGQAFNGFGAVDDANASTVRFLATTGSLTLNLIDCTVDGVSPVASGGGQNFSVDDAAGMTVTVVVAPVTLLVTVTDAETLLPVEEAQTSIYLLDSPFTELMNEDTTASGIASESYAGSTPVDIKWRVRKSDELDEPRYKAQSGLGEITTAGFTLSVGLIENPVLVPDAPEDPDPVPLAVIQVGSNFATGDDTTISDSDTLVAGTNRKMIVWAVYDDDADDPTISATYDSNAMTSVVFESDTGAHKASEMFWYDVPNGDSGSKTVEATFSSSIANREIFWALVEGTALGAEEDFDSTSPGLGTSVTVTATNTTADAIMIHGNSTTGGSGFGVGSGDVEELDVGGAVGQLHIVSEIVSSAAATTTESNWTLARSPTVCGAIFAEMAQ